MSVIVLTAFSLMACKQSKQATNESNNVSVIEDGWEKTPNSKSDYLLFVEVVEDNIQTPASKRNFYVSDSEGSKVFEESVYGGYVKWLDDYKVEYFSTPGIMPSNKSKEDFIMVYDIKSKETKVKSALNN